MKSYEVVINRCYGGFSLSQEAIVLGIELAEARGCENENWVWDAEYKYGKFTGPRHDPILVEVVKRLGERASGSCAKLVVETIYTSVYKINDYDGMESVKYGDDSWVIIT